MRRFATALLFAFVAAPAASAQTVEERLPVCLSCHGENGQSQNPGVPSLGAQEVFYVTVQLLMFREHMRVADPMNDMAKGLSDDDLRKFAETINKLPTPRPPEERVDAARIERTHALVTQNRCNSCHTATFVGRDNVPNIADQREDYLIKTLRAYKDNSRHGYDATMADVMAPISDEQIPDLAYYIAHIGAK